MKVQKGFTLIELLVVIAIIGILSSVVLASLNTARGKGGDAALKQNLASIRVQAELYYDDNANSYGPATVVGQTCTAGMFSNPTIAAAIFQAEAASGKQMHCAIGTLNSRSTYAIGSELKTSTNVWCTDSTGWAGTSPTAPTSLAFGGGAAANAVCP